MGTTKLPEPPIELITHIRHMASDTESPSEILSYLRERVEDQRTFSHYLFRAFGEHSILASIAFRWWKGDYPGKSADSVLAYVLKETEDTWKQLS